MNPIRNLLLCTALVGALCSPSMAGAQDARPTDDTADEALEAQPTDPMVDKPYRVEDGTLIVVEGGDEMELETPCQGSDVVRSGQTFYLACGTRGVFIAQRDPETGALQPGGYQQFDGEVTGLLVANDRVWATLRRTEARPVGPGAIARAPQADSERVEPKPAEAPEPSAPDRDEPEPTQTPEPQPTPENRPVGEVIAVEPGTVIVGLGRAAGIQRDDHIELYREEQVALGAGETSARIHTIAIGRVVAVSEQRCRVELGLGERVAKSARARPTGAPLTSYPTAPPRIGNLWEASFAVRPFLALRTVGAGTISSGRLVYRFEGPYAIHLNALPLSLGLAREGNVSATGGDVAFAYDARIFSLGLGVGAIQIGYDSLGGIELDERAGPTITQFGRIGARDGLHLRLHNSFVVANREFFYAGTDAVIQIPIDSVVSNSAIVLHGGGHVAGDAVGEAGLRLLVRGNGDRGSLFVTPTVGGGLVTNERRISQCTNEFDTRCRETTSYGGPLIGVDLEWRL